jgi:transcriptional regulator
VAAFWRIIRTKLTPRQCEVIELYAQGLTQTEIAKRLNVNQSSITKSINGNCDYRNGKKIYGGAKKKLRRIAAQDPEIQEILRQMGDIQSEIAV